MNRRRRVDDRRTLRARAARSFTRSGSFASRRPKRSGTSAIFGIDALSSVAPAKLELTLTSPERLLLTLAFVGIAGFLLAGAAYFDDALSPLGFILAASFGASLAFATLARAEPPS